jgi:hypothetical protein
MAAMALQSGAGVFGLQVPQIDTARLGQFSFATWLWDC